MILEDKIVDIGVGVLVNRLTKAYVPVISMQQNNSMNLTDILSDSLMIRHDLPKQVEQSIARIHAYTRAAIIAIAEEVETSKSEVSTVNLMHLDEGTLSRVTRLCEGYKNVRISYRSLSVSFKVLSRSSDKIRSMINDYKARRDVKTATRLELLHSVIVYEILACLIMYLESFRLRGLPIIRSVRQEVLASMDALEESDAELKKNIEAHRTWDQRSKDIELFAIERRQEARNLTRRKWNEIERILLESEEQCGVYKEKLDILRFKLRSAKNQIGTQAAAIITSVVGKDVDSIVRTADLEDFNLAPLDLDMISELLNIRSADEDESTIPVTSQIT
jgi:hypothetical protein